MQTDKAAEELAEEIAAMLQKWEIEGDETYLDLARRIVARVRQGLMDQDNKPL